MDISKNILGKKTVTIIEFSDVVSDDFEIRFVSAKKKQKSYFVGKIRRKFNERFLNLHDFDKNTKIVALSKCFSS